MLSRALINTKILEKVAQRRASREAYIVLGESSTRSEKVARIVARLPPLTVDGEENDARRGSATLSS